MIGCELSFSFILRNGYDILMSLWLEGMDCFLSLSVYEL